MGASPSDFGSRRRLIRALLSCHGWRCGLLAVGLLAAGLWALLAGVSLLASMSPLAYKDERVFFAGLLLLVGLAGIALPLLMAARGVRGIFGGKPRRRCAEWRSGGFLLCGAVLYGYWVVGAIILGVLGARLLR